MYFVMELAYINKFGALGMEVLKFELIKLIKVLLSSMGKREKLEVLKSDCQKKVNFVCTNINFQFLHGNLFNCLQTILPTTTV